MTLLLLGGTADGRKLASRLHQQGVDVIYSVAGLVRMPAVECEVISGGFTQFGGLARYVADHAVTAILDVTHPYAQRMSTSASAAASVCNIPYWRFHRAPWRAQAGDDWQLFSRWDALTAVLKRYTSVFLTCGQLSQQQLDALDGPGQHKFLLRTAVAPAYTLPPNVRWIKAIGPFALDDELALMQQHKIQVVVSKNSGGQSTVAKLDAARSMQIPVLMLERPALPAADQQFCTHAECEKAAVDFFAAAKMHPPGGSHAL